MSLLGRDDSVLPSDSVSQCSRKTSSSVGSQRLVNEQKKAELLARARALKRKQQLEINKLKLKQEELKINQEEEQLDLDTELEVVSAQEEILSKYDLKLNVPPTSSDVDEKLDLSFNPRSNIEVEEGGHPFPTVPGLHLLAQAATDMLDKHAGTFPHLEAELTVNDVMGAASRTDELSRSVTGTNDSLVYGYSSAHKNVKDSLSLDRPQLQVRSDPFYYCRPNRFNVNKGKLEPNSVINKHVTVNNDSGQGQESARQSSVVSNTVRKKVTIMNDDIGQGSVFIGAVSDSQMTPSSIQTRPVLSSNQGQGNANLFSDMFSKDDVTSSGNPRPLYSSARGQGNDVFSSMLDKTYVVSSDILGHSYIGDSNRGQGNVSSSNQGQENVFSGPKVSAMNYDSKHDMPIHMSSESQGQNNVFSGSDSRQHVHPYNMPMQAEDYGQFNSDMVSVLKQIRKPIPDIKKFSGDPLEYNKFIRQFLSKIVVNAESNDELLMYLEQFTIGEANKIVQGFSYYTDASLGYEAAINELKDRYGNNEVLANAFIKKAIDWPSIQSDKPKALDSYSIFLSECESAINAIDALKILEYPENIRKLVGKLPVSFHEKWRNLVVQIRDTNRLVSFSHFVSFVKREAKKANDPTYGREAMTEHVANKHKGQLGQRQSSSWKPKSSSFAAAKVNRSGAAPHYLKPSGQANTGGKSNKTPIKSNGRDKPCAHCNDTAHCLLECEAFAAQSNSDKIDFIRSKGYCFGCFRGGHQKKSCYIKEICRKCHKHHPTVLHFDSPPDGDNGPKESTEVKPPQVSSASYSDMGAGEEDVAMAIIPVKVKLRNGIKIVDTYAFLDPGSNVSFCSDSLIKRIGGTGKSMKLTIDTMGGTHTMSTRAISNLEIYDIDLTSCVTVPKLYTKQRMPVSRSHIPRKEDIEEWQHLQDLTLHTVDEDIGLLIGNNIPDAYSPLETRTGPSGSPHGCKTRLGWVLWNVICSQGKPCKSMVNRADIIAIEEIEELHNLETMVKRSINLDFPEHAGKERRELSVEDKHFMEKVNNSIRLVDQHYEIALPFKGDEVKLPNNSRMALNRLNSLKNKLMKDQRFYEDYQKFMSNIIDKGYAEVAPSDSVNVHFGKVWYIPHHGVYHPRKPNKIRVVFDCAALYEGISLNNLLLPGPDLTNSLIGVLMRFRQENTALMADIESMFYQVQVPEKDRDYLRFFWWPEGKLDKPPVEYRMTVHLFGAASSPSVANSALKQMASDHADTFSKHTTAIINKNFYVDDCLFSEGTENKAIEVSREVTNLCDKGGFRLTKWLSNSKNVILSIPEEERAKEVKCIDLLQEKLPNGRALGILWDTHSDVLGFQVDIQDKPPTRRGILSMVSSIYDPLGLAAPFILPAKVILQDVCRASLAWDERLDGVVLQKWQKWTSELNKLEYLQITRSYKPAGFGNVESCEIHSFADASNIGYGVAVYIRLANSEGQVYCSLVMGKSRVAPLKKITIPRMELTAAMVAVRLSQIVAQEIEYPVSKMYFWTDSMSVIKYVNNESTRFKTFVANRVSVIREATEVGNWKYVNTAENPADDASRGQSIDKFLENRRWFDGPKFLWKEKSEWPETPISSNLSAQDPETQKLVNMAIACGDVTDEEIMERILNYFSDFVKLKRFVAWIQLAWNNLRRYTQKRKEIRAGQADENVGVNQCNQRKKGEIENDRTEPTDLHISSEMLDKAEYAITKYIQRKHFAQELKSLEKGAQVKATSPLYKLDPILEDGIIRVGGRLDKADLPYSAKHPVLLPKNSPVTMSLLYHTHKVVGHLGKNAMLAALRQKYWVIGASSNIKCVIAKCVLCRKYAAKAGQQKMANLPSERLLSNEPPFTNVGMDYFGPFYIKRGRSTVKLYGVIFTCLAMRAIHLEIAHSLDTDSCINAIRRFVARRGTVRFIRSDNGTNLVGAKGELEESIRKFNQNKITKKFSQKGIQWEFNPPGASHFGGVWERMIRTVRKVLFSLMQQQGNSLNEESLTTLFCEVEAIVNSRPITDAPNSPNDLDALTPNHLLHMNSEVLPPGLFVSEDNYVKRRWRQVQYLADIFWKRWSKEYLAILQLRQKWQTVKRNITENDIVLLIDNGPRNAWTLGRVVEVIRDKRGFVRQARVRTKCDTYHRPVSKICLLVESDKN